MDTLPQGLPQDNRRIVRRLRDDPLFGGPPASGPGIHPDEPRESVLVMPLPNFERLYRDGLPCHIPPTSLQPHYRKHLEEARELSPSLDANTLPVAEPLRQFRDIDYLHFFASQQPLTVEPLADGSNILLAPRGSIEYGFRDAFKWYTRYLEWLHYMTINDERINRLAELKERVESLHKKQQKNRGRRSNEVNGLYPIPAVLQDWVWPWHFFLIWEVRQALLPDVDSAPMRIQDMSIQVLNMLMYAEIRFEDMLMGNAGSTIFMPEDRFPAVLGFVPEDTALQVWTMDIAFSFVRDINRLANRVFHLKALRHWGFKRPWKQLWSVFNPQEISEIEEEQQVADRVIVEVQRRLHADVHGSQLLTYHPVLPRQVNDVADSCPLAACGGDPWKTDDQIMETVCGHIACVDCMIQYWESHVSGLGGATADDWPCPFCRQSPGKLRTRINIVQTQGLGADFDERADRQAI